MVQILELRKRRGRPPRVADGAALPEATRQAVRCTAYIDPALHRQLRRAVAEDGSSYSSVVERALREYLAAVAS